MRKGDRYLACPDCGKRGVHFVRPGGGGGYNDGHECRYCDFWVYAGSTMSEDELNLDRLRAANPELAEVL